MSVRRGHWAALASLMWVLGFDVVPLVHMVFHEALEEHHHGHHYEQAHQHERDADTPSPAGHGEGSVAHRDLAANVPAPTVPEVVEALLTWAAPSVGSHDTGPTDRQPQTTRARAPPNVAG